MCAIAGFVSYNGQRLDERQIDAMLDTMKQRGPDENGVRRYSCADLLHARLAVIDVEHGKQPMTVRYSDAEYTLVYNGELYNTDEVRDELKRGGMSFDSRSDTEVVLKAFAVWGCECVKKFNGIFAIAVWNESEKTLFLARDHFGVKPLFYALAGGGLIFSSEIKTLLASGLVEPVIDKDGIADLILIAPGRTPGSGVFSGVCEVKPGCCGFFGSGGLSLSTYWTLDDIPHPEDTGATIDSVHRLVEDAIKRQLVSDVPIGTFLSGGLDSSLISSVANRYFKERGERLLTFSVTYKDNLKYFKKSHFQPNSDDEYINKMVDYLGCDHVDVVIDTPALAGALEEAVLARDLPGMADVDSSLLLFCREIKKYVTVALSGECADEIFGGYPWYRDRDLRQRYGFPWSRNYEYRASFLNPEIAVKIDAKSYVGERYEASCREAPKLPGLDPEECRMREMSYLNFYWFMQTLLDRKDRMSMYSGLEVRVPFCDTRVAQYLYSTPWALKDLDGYEKGLLRKAFVGYLPDEVLWRKKSPYPKTHNPDYMEAVVSLMRESLSDNNAPILKILGREKIESLYYKSDAEPWYGQLMTCPQTIAYFWMLNFWLKKYNVKIEI